MTTATTEQKLRCVQNRIDDIAAWCEKHGTTDYPVTFCSFSYEELLTMYADLSVKLATEQGED